MIKPFGPGHFLNGLSVSHNTFKSLNGQIDRIERVDDSIAPLDPGMARRVEFGGNTFNGVVQETISPVTLEFDQPTNASVWTLDAGPWLPFGGRSRTVSAVVPEGELKTTGAAAVHAMPSATPEDGPARNRVRLGWPVPTRGRVQVTVRADKPY